MPDPLNPPPGSQAAPTDSFFVLRDCRELFRSRLTEIARAAGVAMPHILEAWRNALGEGYDELASQAQRAGFEQAAGLTASRITLMCEDDLELEIRIGEITKRLADIGGTALWKAHLRYMALLRRPEMAKEDNPVGPEAIALGLWAICRESGGSLENRFTLLERLEGQFRTGLPLFYDELNDLLARRGVGAALMQPVLSGNARAATGTAAPGSPEVAGNPLAALHGAISGQGRPGAPAAGEVTLGAATLAMLNQLLARLGSIDLAALPAVPVMTNPTGQATLRDLKAAELGLAPGGAEASALDTLAHIFEAIFARPDLPDAVKAAFGRLQIPLLKVAVVDATFFADAEHPARRLVNGLGRAVLGLPLRAGREHPLCARLDGLAEAAAACLGKEPAALATVLTEVNALIGEREAAADAATQSFLPLALEQERTFKALAAAVQWAANLGQERELPPAIGRFVDDHWVHVMQAAWLAGGETGAPWQEAAATIVDLLWSIEPKPGPEERKRLAGLVPGLLQRINRGLDGIGVSQEKRAPFLDACFALQTAALRGAAAGGSLGAANMAASMSPGEAMPLLKTLELAGRRLLCLQLPGDGRSVYRLAGAPWALGDWLRIRLPGEAEPRCGRLGWLSPQTGAALLANPDWSDVVLVTPAIIEQQLRAGEARVASAAALFDSAAEQALRQLLG